ncbi:MAG: DUF3501 family protein [Gammaproteobacteria bacterium]|nr:DUF3501 family protein [Gammaproteobacteria bacterium]
MKKIQRQDLLSLEEYARQRGDFRRRAMAHKKNRRLPLSPNATLYFEDRFTMHYQIQEVLRAERLFEPREVQEEIDTYNELIPDGSNWIATLMFEYSDIQERTTALGRMGGIEYRVFVRIGERDPIFVIANEDLDRTDQEKTSAVHFLRFQLSKEDIETVRNGLEISFGIDHPEMLCCVLIDELLRSELKRDLGL